MFGEMISRVMEELANCGYPTLMLIKETIFELWPQIAPNHAEDLAVEIFKKMT